MCLAVKATWEEYTKIPLGMSVSPQMLIDGFGCGRGDPSEALCKFMQELEGSKVPALQALSAGFALVVLAGEPAGELFPTVKSLNKSLEQHLAGKTMIAVDISFRSGLRVKVARVAIMPAITMIWARQGEGGGGEGIIRVTSTGNHRTGHHYIPGREWWGVRAGNGGGSWPGGGISQQ